ncbi:MAG: T9SS type A sorting domain-containing protein [Candidatus Stahlbacteria bacterium]|nr:MAG: T9SS type A sorting domain-containing protein [Candidatus Stahlbacteria bacterium]
MKGLLKALCGLALAFGLIWANTYDGPAIIWNKVYDSGAQDMANGVAVDDNFVYVTGSFFNENEEDWDFLTICYDKDGNRIWNKTYGTSAGSEQARGVTVDDESIYVTGYSSIWSGYDFLTIRYDKRYGDLIWNKVYDSGNDDRANGVAVDGEFVYVTGWYFNGTDEDYLTICYDKDGNLIWNTVYDSGIRDVAQGVAVDDRFVYVTGRSWNGGEKDFLTICYDKNGDLIWNKVYGSRAFSELAFGVAVDDNFVYVTGWGPSFSLLTICYDKDGNLIWDKTYDSGNDDHATGVAVDEQGYLYVTGWSSNGTDYDFQTIKYDRTVWIDELPALGFKLDLKEPAPNPFKLSTDIYYSLAHSGLVNLKVYDVSGRPVKTLSSGIKASGYYAITWDGRDDLGRAVAPGVYFIRMQAGNHTATRKLIRVR